MGQNYIYKCEQARDKINWRMIFISYYRRQLISWMAWRPSTVQRW